MAEKAIDKSAGDNASIEYFNLKVKSQVNYPAYYKNEF